MRAGTRRLIAQTLRVFVMLGRERRPKRRPQAPPRARGACSGLRIDPRDNSVVGSAQVRDADRSAEADAFVPGAPVGPQRLEHLQVATSGGRLRRHLVPGGPVGAGPLEHLQVATTCSHRRGRATSERVELVVQLRGSHPDETPQARPPLPRLYPTPTATIQRAPTAGRPRCTVLQRGGSRTLGREQAPFRRAGWI